MDGGKGVFDSFRVEEAYRWRDDIMEITRRIVHETDEARINNIADHFEVDLSEIREFLKMKQRQKRKPQTNADRIRSMTDEELAEWIANLHCPHYEDDDYTCDDCEECWIDWLKQEAKENK